MKKTLIALAISFAATTSFASLSATSANSDKEGVVASALSKLNEGAKELKESAVNTIQDLTLTKDKSIELIKKALNTLEVPEDVTKINPATIGNGELFEVSIKGSEGSLFFARDGKSFIAGQHMIIEGKEVVSEMQKRAFGKLEDIAKEAIVHKAKNEKHIVTVFFDPTCGYCRKLYQEMKSYNDKGITVRLIAFPREGLDSKLATQMEAVFTSTDPVKALEDMEKGKMPTNLKEPNIVKKHYEYGLEYGVRGTPAIITPKGTLLPGYLSADRLLEALN